MFASLIVAVALQAAALPSAPIRNPQWLNRPNGDDIARVYPKTAQRAKLGGAAELDCLLALTGRLEQCYVLAETPAGAGFGTAALALAPSFQLTPPPQAGAIVMIPIRFSIDNHPLAGSLTITEPRWAAAPTFEDVAAAYPGGAGGATGAVDLQCVVLSAGVLGSCQSVNESPAGQGFGAAALSLAGHFKLDRIATGYKPVNPLPVRVTVHFTDPKSEAFQARRIGAPTWLTMFDPVQATALFPVQAAAKGLKTGRGVATCRVVADGHLEGCAPGAAEPEGLGFSEAAVIAASVMRMNPWTSDGGPVNGAAVSIPIRFSLTANAKPATP